MYDMLDVRAAQNGRVPLLAAAMNTGRYEHLELLSQDDLNRDATVSAVIHGYLDQAEFRSSSCLGIMATWTCQAAVTSLAVQELGTVRRGEH